MIKTINRKKLTVGNIELFFYGTFYAFQNYKKHKNKPIKTFYYCLSAMSACYNEYQ